MSVTKNFLEEEKCDGQRVKKVPQCCLSRAALSIRIFLKWLLFKQGRFIQKKPFATLLIGAVLMSLSCIGLKEAEIVTDLGTLWIPKGGRLQEESDFRVNAVRDFTRNLNAKSISKRHADRKMGQILGSDNALGTSGFQVLIQTPEIYGSDMSNRKDLMLHAEVMEEVSRLSVEMFGTNWTLNDLCFKPPVPPVRIGFVFGLGEFLELLFDRMMPCVLITPLDCFWDGAKPLGPHPGLELPEMMSSFVESLPKETNLTWKNFHPMGVLEEAASIVELDLLLDSFKRAGVGSGYLNRPCVNPLDSECPKTAPNFIKDFCKITENFVSWNEQQPIKNRVELAEDKIDILEAEYTDYPDYNYDSSAAKSEICGKFEKSVRKLLNFDPEVAEKFFENTEIKIFDLNFSKILSGGCPSVGKNYLHWPPEMILGGKFENGRKNDGLRKIEALQTIMIMAGETEVYSRYKDCFQRKLCKTVKPTLNNLEWSPRASKAVIDAWQRKFVDFIYNHDSNKVYKNVSGQEFVRVVHPLSATSLEDMLKLFSKFKPMFLMISYMLMLLYAGFCLFSAKNHGVNSCSGLAVFGVLLVTLASASGLGFATLLGSKFNAATTQIVPFLTLGLGVDDIFLLVHNYQTVASRYTDNELGYLLRKTGLSVLLTSINNVLAFLAGSFVNVPAMKDFCLQVAILLLFNVIAVLTMYPAMMAVDLMRKRNKRLDIVCCIQIQEKTELTSNGISSSALIACTNGSGVASTKGRDVVLKRQLTHWDDISLQAFVMNLYGPLLEKNWVKGVVLLLATLLLSFSIFGVCMGEQGLDLTDVVPKNTAPYSFLEAREKYFSFYPMFSVIKGPLDFVKQQKLITEFRDEMLRSDWTVSSEVKLGQFWLGLLGDYLRKLQEGYLREVESGNINGTQVKKRASFEAKLAHKLICNTGKGVNCSRNLESVMLVEEDGLINEAGFYKYVTAFYNLDNIMFYVSQANFYPAPPKWVHDEKILDQEIPEAHPPIVSQIPFYLNGLVDTKLTVRAIKELRTIAENFTAKGLPNFPQGIPFTFWEQYFYLVRNLLIDLAIITSCVFVVISILLMSPWAATIVVGILIMIVAELCGFMGLVGLKLNPISAVSLITAVGIGVEFTVHMTLAFLKSEGTNNERMKKTLEEMFVPVAHGGVSTVLGIIVLAFSEFEFICRYFFMVMAGLVVIGLLNGLILLPVLLSLIGPPTEIKPDLSRNSRFWLSDLDLTSRQSSELKPMVDIMNGDT